MIKNTLGLLILTVGIILAYFILKTAPVAATTEKKQSARIVQTIEVSSADHAVSVFANGTVIPSRQLMVSPEISARIISQHPDLEPGGRIAAGETLFQLDPSEFEIALLDARASLEAAEAAISVEDGRQIVAKREYQQLLEDLPSAEINRALVLREPFKRQADAAVARVKAAISLAELNLERTLFRSPFNALVIEESVETGQLADPGQTLATLVGADAFWIEVGVPFSALASIQLPTKDREGAAARVSFTNSSQSRTPPRTGKVLRLLGSLEENDRLARILVEVPAPLDPANGPPLLLGSYVEVEIEAGTIPDALEIPRGALREGNRLWAVGEDNTLVVHEAEVLWRNQDTVFVSNVLGQGEKVIVSELSSPLPGLLLAPQPAP